MDPIADRQRFVFVSDLVKEDCELVSPEPRDRIAASDRVKKATGNSFEQFISSQMSKPIVDDLELIEVQEDEGKAISIPSHSAI